MVVIGAGTSGTCAALAAAQAGAKTVIVEVNKNMPVCLGGFENCIHIDDVDMIVEGENPALDELGGAGDL